MADKEKEKQKKPQAQQQQQKGAGKKDKKPKGPAQEVEVESGPDEAAAPAPPPRLIAHYREKVVPELKQRFGYTNNLEVPRLEKIVISMGVGKYAVAGGEGKAKIEQAEKELGVIAGQKPVRTKAKKSVANFKVREGMETGLKVTLRGNRMWEFLDRMLTLAFPRVKDFRGESPESFDRSGNYNFGFTEQTVFPEVDAAAVNFQQGMNVTIVTTAHKPEEGRELLKLFGFPFRTEEKEPGRR
jgi:large subunit ribosomal protein L5